MIWIRLFKEQKEKLMFVRTYDVDICTNSWTVSCRLSLEIVRIEVWHQSAGQSSSVSRYRAKRYLSVVQEFSARNSINHVSFWGRRVRRVSVPYFTTERQQRRQSGHHNERFQYQRISLNGEEATFVIHAVKEKIGQHTPAFSLSSFNSQWSRRYTVELRKSAVFSTIQCKSC